MSRIQPSRPMVRGMAPKLSMPEPLLRGGQAGLPHRFRLRAVPRVEQGSPGLLAECRSGAGRSKQR